MQRRKFLHYSALLSMGVLTFPSILFSNENDKSISESDFKGKVLIIGAGAAGAYAGFLLKSKGIDFEILEASSIIGGRMGVINDFSDFSLDTGAQWLHGKNSIVGNWVKESNTNTSKDNSDVFYWFKKEIRKKLKIDVEHFFDSKTAGDISFSDYANEKGWGSDYQFIVEAMAGDLGADASLISVENNRKEFENWNSGNSDYKFENSFFDLLNEKVFNTIQENTRLNTVVSAIDYSNNQVSVTDSKGNIYNADKVMVTIPISILKEGAIKFKPVLPVEKTDAFQKIGMGPGMKVFLKFKTRFYKENILGGEICAAYTDESVGKSGQDNVLMAFVMGNQAKKLSSLANDMDICKALITELDDMYDGQASIQFIDAKVIDWSIHPFIKGAYSYSTVGMGNARSIASESIAGTLFFAGEAMNINGHHQTVHGAMETAYNEVNKILYP